MDWIPVAGPWVTDKEVQYTADAAANACYANANVYPARFEKALAEFLGVAHAVSLRSCTSALAAEAVGLEFRGRRAGSFGDIGTFSFHGSKTLTTGEGGMLVTSR